MDSYNRNKINPPVLLLQGGTLYLIFGIRFLRVCKNKVPLGEEGFREIDFL